MTLLEMKKKILSLIEEIDTNETSLTGDPDIEQKLNHVINQIMFELARFKKIPGYVEIEVNRGDLVKFEDIEAADGYEVFQLGIVRGIDFEFRADGTIIKCMEDGTVEIDYYRYPERITENTKDSYEFELSLDVLEILPYGAAADLLKSDVSNNYGQIYEERYRYMVDRLDSRYKMMGAVTFDGGYI